MIQQNVIVVFGHSFRHHKSVESKIFFSNGELNSISSEKHEHEFIYRHLFCEKTYICPLFRKCNIFFLLFGWFEYSQRNKPRIISKKGNISSNEIPNKPAMRNNEYGFASVTWLCDVSFWLKKNSIHCNTIDKFIRLTLMFIVYSVNNPDPDLVHFRYNHNLHAFS